MGPAGQRHHRAHHMSSPGLLILVPLRPGWWPHPGKAPGNPTRRKERENGATGVCGPGWQGLGTGLGEVLGVWSL